MRWDESGRIGVCASAHSNMKRIAAFVVVWLESRDITVVIIEPYSFFSEVIADIVLEGGQIVIVKFNSENLDDSLAVCRMKDDAMMSLWFSTFVYVEHVSTIWSPKFTLWITPAMPMCNGWWWKRSGVIWCGMFLSGVASSGPGINWGEASQGKGLAHNGDASHDLDCHPGPPSMGYHSRGFVYLITSFH